MNSDDVVAVVAVVAESSKMYDTKKFQYHNDSVPGIFEYCPCSVVLELTYISLNSFDFEKVQ